MERSIAEEARMHAEYSIAQYRYLMRKADEAHDSGDIAMYHHYQGKAMGAARRVDDLCGLTDEGVRYVGRHEPSS